ncbi:MAG: hypothetical protein PHW77_08365, partial [Eubacteriales bacterium]|nr:hypothetical protein [Eubacteriales bacterium]
YVDRSNIIASSYINITDRQAHAWVEVYCDGVGWVTVNVTPGFPTSGNDHGISDASDPDTSSPDISDNLYDDESQNESSVDESEAVIPADSDGNSVILYVCITVALAAILTIIRRYYMLYLRNKRFSDNSNNKSVINMWKYLTALTRSASPPEGEIYAVAEKARFSQHIVNDTEKKTVADYTVQLAKTIYSRKSIFGKFAMKYIYALY